MYTVILTLCLFTCLSIFLFVWAQKARWKNSNFMSVKGQYFLSSRERFLLISWNQKEYLCFAGSQGLTLVDSHQNKLVDNEKFEKILAQSCSV